MKISPAQKSKALSCGSEVLVKNGRCFSNCHRRTTLPLVVRHCMDSWKVPFLWKMFVTFPYNPLPSSLHSLSSSFPSFSSSISTFCSFFTPYDPGISPSPMSCLVVECLAFIEWCQFHWSERKENMFHWCHGKAIALLLHRI